MKPTEPLTASRVRELLNYDPETGKFTWRAHRQKWPPGSKAGSLDRYGYVVVVTGGCTYKAHRLAWLYMTGEWPKEQIDHIDGVKSNNRWANLREATEAENKYNARRRKDNTSGFKGVKRRGRKWCAAIRINGTDKQIGSFDTPEAAHEAYKRAATEAFGEFARFE